MWQQGGLRRINILEGSVRSGKTWISLVLWAFWVATQPPGESFLMAAKTLSSLRRNCLDPLQTLVGAGKFTYSVSKKEGRLFGRTVYFEGASDARAQGKIRGMTLAGAYCDELTLLTEEFFAMLLSRLSVPGAKLFATTNPDSPNHWLMEKYLSRRAALDMLVMRFTIEDNFALDPDYVESLKREYTGVFYDRFIRGEWVVAQGLVYPMFDAHKHVITAADNGAGDYYISVDYGTANPCSMGLWCVPRGGGYAVRLSEYYYDSRKRTGQKTDEEYYAELVRLAGGRVIQSVIADPSAASFIATIRRHGGFRVKKADNAVLDGIRVTASLLAAGKLRFDESCTDCIREFGLYSWDEKAADDRVLKESDHAMDDVRYFCQTVLRREFKWDVWGVG